MKFTALTILFSLMSVLSSGQEKATIDSILPIDEKSGLIQFQEVIEVTGTPSELYDRAEIWIKDYFPNPSGVIGARSKDDGYINGTVRIRILDYDRKGQMTGSPRIVYCGMKLEFKQDRYRYSFSEFKLQATSNFPLERWLNPDSHYYSALNMPYLLQVRVEMEKLIDALNKAMQPVEEVKDEW